jgi:hypothetical protein
MVTTADERGRCGERESHLQECAFHAMGCRMLALVDAEAPAAQEALAQVPDWFASASGS